MINKNSITDEQLTAFLDGELAANDYDELSDLIALDEDLQHRVESLRVEFGGLKTAFQQLSVPDFKEQIATINKAASAKQRPTFWSSSRTAIAAGVVGAAFAAGLLINQLNISSIDQPVGQMASAKMPGWRQSVANYIALYTAETLNRVEHSPESLHRNLVLLSQDLGLSLNSENVSVGGLDYKRGQLLGLGGKPLVQLAYLYQGKTPVAFCIIKSTKGKKSMQFEKRSGLEIAHWSSDSHGFMVIGALPKDELSKLAKSFSVRF